MEKLLEILNELRPDLDFVGATALIDDCLLDSFDIVALVGELNDAFGVNIGADSLLPENFNSPEAMLALVNKLKAGK